MVRIKSIKPISINNFMSVFLTNYNEKDMMRINKIMPIRKSFLLFLVFQLQLPPSNTVEVQTLKHCCELGQNHSLAGNDCSTFQATTSKVIGADSVQCLNFGGVCCAKKQSQLECEAGESLGLSGQDCSSASGNKKICCESCVLGKAASSGDPSCFDLGLGSSFVKCCKAAVTTKTTATTTTTTTAATSSSPGKSFDNVPRMENLCEVEGICAQICIPVGGSYKCDCHKGYSLMADKVSCKPDQNTRKGLSRCDLNNPCEHECLDTGVAVKCLCREGYELDIDNTSCKDIDECALKLHECIKGEICVNEEGNYYCEDPNYTDSPSESENKCPTGYKFSGDTGLCDDIDECEISLLCPSPKICKNTIGSYICQGEDVKCPPGFYYKAATESCSDIDECITGENDCNKESQICINTKGNYTCAEKVSTKTCPPGFKKNPFTQLCDDIDECADDIPLCAPTEQCINEKGSYNCVPKIRPTSPSTVASTQTSTVRPSRYPPQRPPSFTTSTTTKTVLTETPRPRLQCSKGFTLSTDGKTCVDINECQLRVHSCKDTQRCDNTVGSYHCVRMAGCGTGYTYNYAEELCEDDDECELGTHNCGGLGSGFKCRNTYGSYRCDPVRRPPVTVKTTVRPTTPKITDLTVISGQRKTCLPGYSMNNRGDCEDVDECLSNPCARGEICYNVPGRYQCISNIQCKAGYDLNEAGDGCEDVNECVRGIHKCNPTQLCRNGDGYYTCVCPPGHHLNPQTNRCEDFDECKYYKVCYHNANCVNTVGSYRCECKEGFRDSGRGCEDIDECAENPSRCEHRCINFWGSFRCTCQAGFTLNSDNRTCTDIDECETFKDKKLCIGPCENIPGSYRCSCPSGYRLGSDKRTCQDIDECERKVCPNHNDICVNTRGSYKCYTIECPPNYIRDSQHKSRCKKPQTLCDARDLACVLKPELYTYHFIAIVSNLPILNGHISLFTIQGPRFTRARTEFNFRIVRVSCPALVPKINENYFRMDVQNYSAMKLYLTRSITGPQEAELEIQMKLYDNNQLTMSAISRLFIIVTEYPF
ncbi:fibulin-1-like isoform X1 [Coccinella septempunctata]|uniref:fibulin-1-like isoform X1 n=1 Tax=Coccinella septempunctata TaxID=41139 RepID=UPI001D067DB2|nr:fibulin-1-like isoform X1 [Coccinella septempunctata]